MYTLIRYNLTLLFEKIDGFFGPSFSALHEYLITIMYICLRFDENLLKSQFNVHLHALIERLLFFAVGEGLI